MMEWFLVFACAVGLMRMSDGFLAWPDPIYRLAPLVALDMNCRPGSRTHLTWALSCRIVTS